MRGRGCARARRRGVISAVRDEDACGRAERGAGRPRQPVDRAGPAASGPRLLARV